MVCFVLVEFCSGGCAQSGYGVSFFVEFCSGGLGQSGCVPFCSVVFWKVTAVMLSFVL